MNAIARAPLQGELLGPADKLLVSAITHPLEVTVQWVLVDVGSSVAEIVDACGKQGGVSRLDRGAIVRINGHLVIREHWHRVRVKAGAQVSVRAVAGRGIGNILKSVLSLALIAVAGWIVGPAALGLTGLTAKLAMGALTLAGGMALNALFPPAAARGSDQGEQLYSIGARQNQAALWQPIPDIFGTHRVAGKYGASPYTEIEGKDQYLYLLIVWGHGPMRVRNLRIGGTPIEQFDDVTIETREGYATDLPITLIPSAVFQEDFQIEPDPADAPSVRDAADEAVEIAIDLEAPGGLYNVDVAGSGRLGPHTVQFRMQIVNRDTGAVEVDRQINMTAASKDQIRRTVKSKVRKGRYFVRLTRLTKIDGGRDIVDKVVWTALRAYRDDPVVRYPKPLAKTALKIRASRQLNSIVSDLTAECTRMGRQWDGKQWLENQPIRSPADQLASSALGPAMVRPQPAGMLDWPAIEAWADLCRQKGWTFDVYQDGQIAVPTMWHDICAAGRAVQIYRDGKISVAMEDDNAPVIEMFTAHTVSNWRTTVTYPEPVHALRCRFANELKDFAEDELIVYADGYDHTNAKEYIEFPTKGLTHPETIWKHGRYHLAALLLRNAVHSFSTDAMSLGVYRGAKIKASHYVVHDKAVTGRVESVEGQQVTLDAPVTMVAGEVYAIESRRALAAGTMVATNPVTTAAGTRDTITVAGTPPRPGDTFAFGRPKEISGTYRVLRFEGRPDFEGDFEVVDDAPGIQSADEGPIDLDPALYQPVESIALYRPRNLAVETRLITDASGARWRTRLSWSVAPGPLVRAFEIGATSVHGQIAATAGGELFSHDFFDLTEGLWTFSVRTALSDGRSTPPTLLEAAISDNQGALGRVIDLRMIDAVSEGQFAGTDAEFAWGHDFPGSEAALYAGNIVRVFDVVTGDLLREEPTTEARFVYTIARNAADSARFGRRSTRRFRLEVAVTDIYGGVSPFVSVVAYNPPPEAVTPIVIPGFRQVVVRWVLPPDPDVEGARVWIGDHEAFDVRTTEPFYDGSVTSVVIPVEEGTRWLRIAAYDSFDRDASTLNVSRVVELVPITTTVDVEAPASPTGFRIVSTLDAAGMALVEFSWDENTESDLSHYRLLASLNRGNDTSTIIGSNYHRATVLPGTLVRARLQAVDRSGNVSNTTPAIEHHAAQDKTAPAVPTGFKANSNFSTVWYSWTRNAEPDLSHYELHINETGTLPTSTATFVKSSDETYLHQTTGGTTVHAWLRARDTSGNASAWSAKVQAKTLSDSDVTITTEKLKSLVDRTSFASGLTPVEVLTQLPAGNNVGRVASFNGELYRGAANGWAKSVPATDVTGQLTDGQIAAIAAAKVSGQLTDTQIAAISAAKLTGQVVATQIASLPTDKLTGQVTDAQIAALSASKVSGKLTDAQLEAISTTKLVGQVVANQITSLPTNKLTGTILNAQLAAAAVDASKLASGAVTEVKIAPDAVTAPKIAVGAVIADKIAANAVTAKHLVVADATNIVPNGEVLNAEGWLIPTGIDFYPNPTRTSGAGEFGYTKVPGHAFFMNPVASKPFSVTRGDSLRCSVEQWQNADAHVWHRVHWFDASGVEFADPNRYSTIRGGLLPAGNHSMVADITVPAGAVTAEVRSYVERTDMPDGSRVVFGAYRIYRRLTAELIVDGAVIADKIASNAVDTRHLTASSVTAEKVAANAITASKVAANAITAGKIAAGEINAGHIAAEQVTAAKLAANSVITDKIAAGAVVTSKLTVLSRELINPASSTKHAGGWGGFEEDGSGTSSQGTLTYNAAENALAFTVSGNSSVRSDAFRVDPGAIYRVSLKIKKSAANGRYLIGLAALRDYEKGETFVSGVGNAGTITPFNLDRVQHSDTTNFYFVNTSDAPTAFVNHTYYIIGADRDISEVPAGAANGQFHYAKQVPGLSHMKLRVLNWDNGTQSTTLFIKDVSITEVGGGQIVADQLTANAVRAGKIAANAVTTSTIAANAVQAAHINAGSINTGHLSALAVTAEKLASNSIIARTIDAGAVTAEKIAAGAVTAGKVAANAVTANTIEANAIQTSHISTGAVKADQIAVNAVVASKVLITGARSLILDRYYQDPGYWRPHPHVTLRAAADDARLGSMGVPGAMRLNVAAAVAAGGNMRLHGWLDQRVPLTAGVSYRVRAKVRNTNCNKNLIMSVYDAAPVSGAATISATDPTYQTFAGAYFERIVTGIANIPGALLLPYVDTGTDGTGDWLISDVEISPMTEGSLLVDGAVTARTLAAEELITLSAQIKNGIIDNAKIANLDAGKINTGFLSAARIAAQSLSTSQISIGGGKSLGSWQMGGDSARINGGEISANTIGANALTIGQRGLSLTNIEFEHNKPGVNQLSWTAGFINYIDDNGAAAFASINAGNTPALSGFNAIYWIRGESQLRWASSYGEASGSDRVTLAIYRGGTELVANYGRTIIDGGKIKTQTIQADQIATNAIDARAVAAGAINAGHIQSSSISAQHLASSSITAEKLTAGSVQAQHIATRALSADKIAVGTLTANEIVGNGITRISHFDIADARYSGTNVWHRILSATIPTGLGEQVQLNLTGYLAGPTSASALVREVNFFHFRVLRNGQIINGPRVFSSIVIDKTNGPNHCTQNLDTAFVDNDAPSGNTTYDIEIMREESAQIRLVGCACTFSRFRR